MISKYSKLLFLSTLLITASCNVSNDTAKFPGGKSAMMEYISSNIVYPERALDKEIEGKCMIRFVIEKNGKVAHVRVIKKVPDCPDCDAEAVRVVRSMPRWIPGKEAGMPIKSYFDLPINFRLE